MTDRRLPGAVAALVLLVSPLCAGCNSAEQSSDPTAAPSTTPPVAGPSSGDELEALLLEEVPSGLPMVPDHELDPPAGEKTIDDVARYGADAAAQRAVLEDYGYLRGWERFWRSGDRLTSVFLDQFAGTAGAVSYAQDLARNDAEYYGGQLDRQPTDLPHGCVVMARDEPAPEQGFAGPSAFAWCASGIFTLAVAAVAATPSAARAELTAVTVAQLDRLPPG